MTTQRLVIVTFRDRSQYRNVQVFKYPTIRRKTIPIIQAKRAFRLLNVRCLISRITLRIGERIRSFPKDASTRATSRLKDKATRVLTIINHSMSIAICVFMCRITKACIILVLLSNVSNNDNNALIMIFSLYLILRSTSRIMTVRVFGQLSLFNRLCKFSNTSIATNSTFTTRTSSFIFSNHSYRASAVPRIFRQVFPFRNGIRATITRHPRIYFCQNRTCKDQCVRHRRRIFHIPTVVIRFG